MKPLQIYSDVITPRMQYACMILFDVALKIPYRLQSTKEALPDYSETFIWYSVKQTDCANALPIIPRGLVSSNEIIPITPTVSQIQHIPVLFTNAPPCQLGFDIFSAVFFMVSRYEEYLPFTPDSYGRFPEKQSVSGKNNFTKIPVVHHWAKIFYDKISDTNKSSQIIINQPLAIFTYDIDVAYAYRGRTFTTHLLSLGKDLMHFDIKNIQRKIKTRFGAKSDPSDTYSIIEHNPLPTICFFLLAAAKSAYDRNINPKNPILQALIKKLIKAKTKSGIHPSYFSSQNPELIEIEKNTLESITNQRVTLSRQHYLRFRFPDTFRQLIQAGIQHDYSLQYPEMPGFRAGLCLPFPFFDVAANEITSLTLHPGCIMETTFRDDLHIPAAQSLPYYLELWQEVKAVGGQFISIWHNDTLWEGLPDNHPLAFRQVHEKIVEIICRDLNLPVKNL